MGRILHTTNAVATKIVALALGGPNFLPPKKSQRQLAPLTATNAHQPGTSLHLAVCLIRAQTSSRKPRNMD